MVYYYAHRPWSSSESDEFIDLDPFEISSFESNQTLAPKRLKEISLMIISPRISQNQ